MLSLPLMFMWSTFIFFERVFPRFHSFFECRLWVAASVLEQHFVLDERSGVEHTSEPSEVRLLGES